MKVIDELRFEELVEMGSIAHSDCLFLDGIKIGLRLKQVGKILPNEIDLDHPLMVHESIDLRTDSLHPGSLYLFPTVEAICLPDNVFGLLHVRSQLARVGVDCLGSSTYVAPAFGRGTPRNLILEVTSKALLTNFPDELPVAGLVLFETHKPIRPRPTENFFPFEEGPA
jgi:deoxycytidine triphosphate deaminase